MKEKKQPTIFHALNIYCQECRQRETNIPIDYLHEKQLFQ